ARSSGVQRSKILRRSLSEPQANPKPTLGLNAESKVTSEKVQHFFRIVLRFGSEELVGVPLFGMRAFPLRGADSGAYVVPQTVLGLYLLCSTSSSCCVRRAPGLGPDLYGRRPHSAPHPAAASQGTGGRSVSQDSH